jgi:CDP-glucose 4,6-dehydratase
MADMAIASEFWRGRRVLLTGHTGFKGSWLSIWLRSLGAELTGFSVDVPTEPSLYALARLGDTIEWIQADVRDYDSVRAAVARIRPEVVIHMAAQSLVRRSFVDPRETYETNVMGTVNVLEAVRSAGDVRVVINVTSDKCYENREWEWGYREDEAMGGHDPYSNSKGCAELVTSAYRRSFFHSGQDVTRLASVRAGNVIGGGDWGEDRLVPDVMRAVLAGETLRVRNPTAVRPWQHVLNPLSGYLLLAQLLWDEPALAGGWNFGPSDDDAQPVGWIVEEIAERWAGEVRWEHDAGLHVHEAHWLKVDSSRARTRLGWRPRWNLDGGLDALVEWYAAYAGGADVTPLTLGQIERFASADGP